MGVTILTNLPHHCIYAMGQLVRQVSALTRRPVWQCTSLSPSLSMGARRIFSMEDKWWAEARRAVASGVLGEGLRAPRPHSRCQPLPTGYGVWGSAVISPSWVRNPGTNRFLYNFWPLDDRWRLRFLPMISGVWQNLRTVSIGVPIPNLGKLETYKHWPS